MLETSERERLLDRIDYRQPDGGSYWMPLLAPVRAVASKGGGNVLTPYQSRKMQRTVETESRHLEFPLRSASSTTRRYLSISRSPAA